jgi:hypothetical protein
MGCIVALMVLFIPNGVKLIQNSIVIQILIILFICTYKLAIIKDNQSTGCKAVITLFEPFFTKHKYQVVIPTYNDHIFVYVHFGGA